MKQQCIEATNAAHSPSTCCFAGVGVTCSTAGHEPPRPDWDEVQALHYGGEAARGDRDGRHPKQIESEVGSHARDYNSSMRR